jgi:hypothetical protein
LNTRVFEGFLFPSITFEFASIVDAVRCVVVMQAEMNDRNANLDETQRIR